MNGSLKLSRADITAACGYVAGGVGGLMVTLSVAWPTEATKIVACGAIVAFVAAAVGRLYSNKSSAPATSVTQSAQIVSDATTVTDNATVKLGNVNGAH